jgi:transcriptional regulator with PAS, ATPase and Fis domain
VRRVGGKETIPIDFRLVSATNRRLTRDVENGRFRLDLLFRLEVVRIVLPPIRERQADLPHLCRFFLERHAERLGVAIPVLTQQSLNLLTNYWWPGNVRELENEMFRVVALGFKVVRPRHLSEKVRAARMEVNQAKQPRVCRFYDAEREILGAILRAALIRARGNCAETARLLGIPKTSLYRRLQRYGVKVDRVAEGDQQPIAQALARYRFLDTALGRVERDG